MKVTFMNGRENHALTYIDGKVAFPGKNWRGARPRAGETWDVEIDGENPNGTVLFLKQAENTIPTLHVLKLIDSVSLADLERMNQETAEALLDALYEHLKNTLKKDREIQQELGRVTAILESARFNVTKSVVDLRGELCWEIGSKFFAWKQDYENRTVIVVQSEIPKVYFQIDDLKKEIGLFISSPEKPEKLPFPINVSGWQWIGIVK